MNELNNATESFIKSIKATQIYQDYICQKEKISKFPSIKEKIDEFRVRSYELQNSNAPNELFDKIDEFEKQYQEFKENPIVEAFLEAEVSFCRMMQDANWKITEALEFD